MADGFIVRKGGVSGELTPPTPSVFLNATGGTTLEYNLDSKRYRSHTFTSNGTFEVTQLSNLEDFNKVDYLIIAGGSGGRLGGGGAGGYRTTNGTSGGHSLPEEKVTVTIDSFSVTIGAGGGNSASGSNSSVAFLNPIISIAGGTGGDLSNAAIVGGSGGGGGISFAGSRAGAAGTTGQGFSGGNASISVNQSVGGGGGGAGGVGGNNIFGGNLPTQNGMSGPGLYNLLRTGSFEPRASGGAATTGFGNFGGANASFGGGYRTRPNTGTAATVIFSGVANTGGGGTTQAAGGSGIVIIRYEIATV